MDWPLMWTVWLSAASFSIAEGQWFYLLASSFGVSVNMIAVWRTQEVYVHRNFVNLGLVATLVILGLEILLVRLPLVQAMGHCLILLQLCKLFQQKRNRDYVQILSMSGLLMIAATMITNEVWFAVALIGYIFLLCRTAMVFTLKRGLDVVAEARLSIDSRPTEISQLAWNVSRSWPKAALRRRGYLASGFALVTGISVFLIAPRIQIVDPKLLAAAGPAGRLFSGGGGAAATGFAGRVVLGDVAGPVYQSVERKMTVKLIPPPGKGETASARYLCGATFDTYADSQWSRGHYSPKRKPDQPRPDLPAGLLERTMVQEVVMDAALLPNLFASLPVVSIASQDDTWDATLQPDTSAKGSMKSLPGHVRYSAYCLIYPLSDVDRQYLSRLQAFNAPDGLAEASQGVMVAPRVSELAANWCEDLLVLRRKQPEQSGEIDYEIAKRIEGELEKRCSYTLDLTGADSRADGVEDFLFNMKRGHCEYFASAMVVMCRSLGVQARLATGFVMDEYDTAEGVYIVRGRDAHAWAQVYTPSTGWVGFDPSPPGGRRVHREVWGASARRIWNDIKFAWYGKVVGYDASTRDLAWKSLKRVLAVFWKSLKNLALRGEVDRGLVHFVLGIGTIGLIVEGILVSRWVRAATRDRRRTARALPVPARQIGFVRELLKLLGHQGLVRGVGQTLSELAEQAIQKGLPADPVRDVVKLYYRTRWGQEIPSVEELQKARRQVDELRRQLD